MTTEVTVHPAGHAVEIQQWDKSGTDAPDRMVNILMVAPEAESPASVHIWSDRYVVVREVDTGDTP